MAIRKITERSGLDRIVVITTEDHIRRAKHLIQAELPKTAIVACPVKLSEMPHARRLERWLIEYVKNCPELDFQTGSNANDTWFSIYRGTGRVLTIKKNGSLIADEKYKGLFPSFYKSPNKNNLDCLMKEITKEDDLKKYYIGKDGKKKEGYYQNITSI